ncbi:alpha-tocopherol transfer protein-like [Ostrinia nubilalis]|uniref:alpha-tocopherol transfer protein-like n=1 Tax=Ostrinia nubilalis TaxID=29057 RepID=UPI0030825D9A
MAMSIRPLAPELAEKACTNFQEDMDKLRDAVQEIRDWLQTQPHLKARTDEQWLASFIRGCKYNMEKVKKKLDLFYTCRLTASDFNRLHHRNETFRRLVDSGFYLPLPRLKDPAAPRVTLIRLGVPGLLELGAINAFSVTQTIDKLMLVDDDNSIIAGNIVIIDCRNMNLLQWLQLQPLQIKMIIVSQQDAVPFHTNASYLINLPNDFSGLLREILRLLDDQSQNQLNVVDENNYEEMYTNPGLSQDIMPEEYGGSGGTLQEIIDYWRAKIEEYSEWLEEDLQFGTDEALRPEGPRTTENMFGQGLPAEYPSFYNSLNL